MCKQVHIKFKMVKNYIIKSFRVEKETLILLEEASKGLGLNKPDLIRFLLNRSLMQLRTDKIKAGSYEALEITIRNK